MQREFESSHPVVLALFACLGRHKQAAAELGDTKGEGVVRLVVPSSLISVGTPLTHDSPIIARF
jgi:hypothetical protein